MKKILLVAMLFLFTGSAFAFNFGLFESLTSQKWFDLIPSLSWSTNAYEYGEHDTGTRTNATLFRKQRKH